MRTNQFAQSSVVGLFDAVVPAPFGAVGVRLTSDQQHVFELTYLAKGMQSKSGETALAQNVFEQVKAYLVDARHRFDLPLIKQGTVFQNKVWTAIEQIPEGATMTYQTLGALIACGSPRAVGGACGANPYPLIVPCHRIVAANGIGGFARHDDGFHIQIKHWLLAHEGVVY